MLTRKTITIVTSPSSSTTPLPSFGACSSPTTTKQPVQYRIEERRRTVYVTSDVSPSHWNQQSFNTLLSLAEEEGDQEESAEQPVRRTRSFVDTQVVVTEDTNANSDVQELTPRNMQQHSRRPGSRSAPFLRAPNTNSPPDSRRSSPQNRTSTQRILFYHKHDPHYGFTNFSAHPVVYKGKKYPTSEHLFQSFKFQDHRPGLAEHIRTCSERPSVAFSEARRFQPEVRPDWKQVNIDKMDITLWHKFTQHLDLKAELLATGDAELVEDSDKDAFWGVGADRRGRNELGKALERLRARLREAT